MKYIRTKDGIYEVKCETDITYELNTQNMVYRVYKSEVIKQANTIEELCDLFAYNRTFVKGLMLQEIRRYYGTNYQGTLYAYIYGEDGDIIKVAKMNDKGDLELL